MRDSWLEVVDRMLSPQRPSLERCRQAGEEQRAAARLLAKQRTFALNACQQRIEDARAAVFAADNGLIPPSMTALEREWRTLSRFDPDQGLMELWARIAPKSWIDRKRWRDSAPEARLDAAVALAADVAGVELAEGAVGSLRSALAAWGLSLAPRVRWRAADTDADSDCVTALLSSLLQAVRARLSERSVRALERAQELQSEIQAAALRRFPERPLLAQSVARAAHLDAVARALPDRPNPVSPLRELWHSGYSICAIDPRWVTLELPPL